MGVALLNIELDFILGLTGAVAATQLMFIIPTALMYKATILKKVLIIASSSTTIYYV